MFRSTILALSALLLLALALACPAGDPTAPDDGTPIVGSVNARPEMIDSFREDLAATRHPSDGKGRAWIEGDATARCATPGTWEIVYEAGPLGISIGGALYLQVSPFWGWDTPQVVRENGPGYTLVSTEADGVELAPETIGPQLLYVEIGGRPLAEGERIRVVYGAGSMGARADMYAESASPLWIAIDGDGDRVRGVLADSPTIAVSPGDPERLVLTAQSTAHAGEEVRLTIAILDRNANSGIPFEGDVRLLDLPGELTFPETVQFEASDRGSRTITTRATGSGVFRLRGEVELNEATVSAESNPLVVGDHPTVRWADLHGHSSLSDGTGSPEDYLKYARDVSALDIIALTDHDHYGMLFLDAHPDLWQSIEDATRAFHEPRTFVTLLGFEWTSWLYGHRHVLYFGDDGGRIESSISLEAETPQLLWDRLRGRKAMTITHHSAGQPIAADWSIPPDPELEPLAEVMSVHGSSEAIDSPSRLRGFIDGNSVRDALDRGYHLGLIGSGDSHDGHPGFPHLAPSTGYRRANARGPERMGTGGLAGVLTDELTREGVLGALRARAAYATSGPRILLNARLAGRVMGSRIPQQDVAGSAALSMTIVGTAPIDEVSIVRSGDIVHTVRGDGSRSLAFELELEDLEGGEYVYLRVVQNDRGLAWTSPFFVESRESR